MNKDKRITLGSIKTKPVYARDEMNLTEFPLAVLSKRTNSKVKTLEFSESIRKKSGQLINKSWVITAADKFGLPTSTDDDVVLGLMRLSMENGFRERKVFFTRYELIKALNWTTEGRNYSRLSKSLDRLSGVRIKAINSFYDNSSKSCYKTVNFGIIDAYELNDSRGKRDRGRGESSKEKSFFIWSEKLFQSFQSGYIRKLDIEMYFSLDYAVSRRLYRFLDKHFYFKGVIKKNLKTFAFEKLGISRNYKYISQIKQQLEPGLEELKSNNFISHYEYEGKGDNSVIQIYSGNKLKEIDDTNASLTQNKNNTNLEVLNDDYKASLINKLVERGVSLSQSIKLTTSLTESDKDKIEQIISYFDFQQAKDPSKFNNPGGFLHHSIVNRANFKIPSVFKNKFFKNKNSETKIKSKPEAKPSVNNEDSSNQVRKNYFFQYEKFLSQKIKDLSLTIDKPKRELLNEEVEQRLRCLKPVLSEQSYSDALKKAINEKYREALKLPEYKAWLKLQDK